MHSQPVPREIAASVHAVLFEGLDPLKAITRLMSRGLKGEQVGCGIPFEGHSRAVMAGVTDKLRITLVKSKGFL